MNSDRITREGALRGIYRCLFGRLGPQGWWPGETANEVLVGCVLAQNTRWSRVVPVIAGLRQRGLLAPSEFMKMGEDELAHLLRGSGTYRRKARYVRNLGAYMLSRGWNGSPGSMAGHETAELRKELLELKGIGPETADCILLYVLDRPVFVIDAYTRRILSRHALCRPRESYSALQQMFQTALPPDSRMYGEYHGLLVAAAKRWCRPRPRCDRCPLADDQMPGDIPPPAEGCRSG
ncbi:MAG: hypothetical protein R6U36_10875 [Candidatus Fermentibacteraceae bacterium]